MIIHDDSYAVLKVPAIPIKMLRYIGCPFLAILIKRILFIGLDSLFIFLRFFIAYARKIRNGHGAILKIAQIIERSNSIGNIALFICLPGTAINSTLGRVFIAADFLKLRRRLRIFPLRQQALRMLVFAFIALCAPRQADRQHQA